jgi:hypothetical protein
MGLACSWWTLDQQDVIFRHIDDFFENNCLTGVVELFIVLKILPHVGRDVDRLDLAGA